MKVETKVGRKISLTKLRPPGLLITQFCGSRVNIGLFDGDIIVDGIFDTPSQIPFILLREGAKV